ncbi:hypothetical protein BDP27DRAFT_1336914 [Rhodocollybia butyracea]|uniref:Tim44-like domain-containing protein n=1 Tax=Rhodocollybia butyracea TaxID=206335 RepID=A0A9P5U234_9AGAR|nr:hypothetical protein BDP27DRAFT_1336914 [Rhodocollybia butyracea]
MIPRHLRAVAQRSCYARSRTSTALLHNHPTFSSLTFVDVLRDELKKNRELQDNVRQLQGDVDKLQDSEAMKRAREVYERARLTSSIKENPRLRAAAEELKKTGVKVSDAVGEALKTMEESDLARFLSRTSSTISSSIAKSTEPIRKTQAYKSLAESVVDALDDSGSVRHAGFEEKEARQKAGMASRAMGMQLPALSVVLHASASTSDAPESAFSQKLASIRSSYAESEKPSSGWFEENETAKVSRMFKILDPTWTLDGFERELREYIVPEVVDAYLSADKEGLRKWCGEGTYNVLWATMEQYLKQGLISDSKVLDIRQVDVSAGKLIESSGEHGGDLPVFVLLFRNAKTGEVVVGSENRVEQCIYVAVITRVEEELDDPLTGGWKVVEMARRSARAYL